MCKSHYDKIKYDIFNVGHTRRVFPNLPQIDICL